MSIVRKYYWKNRTIFDNSCTRRYEPFKQYPCLLKEGAHYKEIGIACAEDFENGFFNLMVQVSKRINTDRYFFHEEIRSGTIVLVFSKPARRLKKPE